MALRPRPPPLDRRIEFRAIGGDGTGAPAMYVFPSWRGVSTQGRFNVTLTTMSSIVVVGCRTMTTETSTQVQTRVHERQAIKS